MQLDAGVEHLVLDLRGPPPVTAIFRAGYNCRDTAEAIQTHVSDHITTQTGLATIVTVTITDIEFDHNTDEHTAQPPALRVIHP